MEKTLMIDGKSVRFKSTAATPLRYKAQFGRDMFSDMMRMYPLASLEKEKMEENPEQFANAFRQVDFEMFYNILWTMAKTADKSIPEPIEWLDGFDEFPLMDIFPEVQDLLLKNFQTTKKK